MKSETKKNIIIATLIILFGAFSRMISFIPNFSALESLALFSGAYIMRKYLAFVIPFLAMFFSDLLINNTIARVWFPDHDGFVLFSNYMIWNFVSLFLIVVLGQVLLKKVTVLRLIGGVLSSTILFWVVTNFGTWLSGSLYPKTFEGLATCFSLALPFLDNSLLGNFVFASIIFGVYELYNRKNISTDLEPSTKIINHLVK